MGFLGSIGKGIVNLASSTISRTTGISLPTFATGGGGANASAAPSDWNATLEGELYQKAWYGDRPDIFATFKRWADGGIASARNGMNDLLARGWYGGTRSGPYVNDNTSGSVNHGQGIASPTLKSVVDAGIAGALQTAAAQQGADVVVRPLGNAPVNAPNYTTLLLGGGALVAVVALFLFMRK